MALAVNKGALLSVLNTSGLQQKDPPLYQVISQLLDAVSRIAVAVNNLGPSGGGGGSSSVVNNFTTIQQFLSQLGGSSESTIGNCMFPPGLPSVGGSSVEADYVVASDGVIASPSPINDGAGNFIYIPYIPSV